MDVESHREVERNQGWNTLKEVYVLYHPYSFSITEALVTHLSLSFSFDLLTLFPNSGWPSSLPHLPRVAASLSFFSEPHLPPSELLA